MDLTITRRQDNLLTRHHRRDSLSTSDTTTEALIDAYEDLSNNRTGEPFLESIASSSASAYIVVFLLVIFFVVVSPARGAENPNAPKVTTSSDNVYYHQRAGIAMNISLMGILSIHGNHHDSHNVNSPTVSASEVEVRVTLEDEKLSMNDASYARFREFNSSSPALSVLGVPALFGTQVEDNILVGLLDIESDACEPFEFKRPRVGVNSVSDERLKGLQLGWTPKKKKMYNGGKDVENQPSPMHRPTTFEVPYFALIRRGNCPFDVKALNAKNAGFDGSVIYNSPLSGPVSSIHVHEDIPVRMSTSFLSQYQLEETHSSFLSNADATKILSEISPFQNDGEVYKIVLISYRPYPWPKAWGQFTMLESSLPSQSQPLNDYPINSTTYSFLERGAYLLQTPPASLTQFLILFIRSLLFAATFITFCGALCTSFCLIFTICYSQWNRNGGGMQYNHQTFQQQQRGGLMQDWDPVRGMPPPSFGNFGNQEMKLNEQMMLPTITLPIKTITEEDLRLLSKAEEAEKQCSGCDAEKSGDDSNRGGFLRITKDCCAICIDEFVVGSQVRELPCHHVFHHTW
ncbi:hypothetical protein HDV05_005805 [Chytridiales sp. JEL 0842]|nr:hypothetical protein HDV05_005805 [Chytridiales sp. JEL 0842]